MSFALLLNTYLVAEIMAPFFAAFVIVNAVLLFGQIIPLLDLILNLGIGFADLLRLTAYLWPKLLVFSIPMSGMIAVILAFSRLANDGEIMALKSCGLGVHRFFPPVAVVALLLSAISAYAAISLAPAGEANLKKLLFNLAKEKFDHGLKEKYFSEGTGDFVIFVEKIDPESGRWNGVFLSDIRQPDSPVTILAHSGRFMADSSSYRIELQLEDGSIHRTKGETVQTVLFEKYDLAIPLPLPRNIGGQDMLALGKRSMPLSRLRKSAESAEPGSPERISLLMEFHKRLATSVGCFLLCMLGLPLGLLAGPGKRAIGLPLGILLFLGYFIVLSAGKAVSQGGLVPVWLALWAANALFAVFCGLLLFASAREKLPLLLSWLENIAFRISLLFLRKRHSQKATP